MQVQTSPDATQRSLPLPNYSILMGYSEIYSTVLKDGYSYDAPPPMPSRYNPEGNQNSVKGLSNSMKSLNVDEFEYGEDSIGQVDSHDEDDYFSDRYDDYQERGRDYADNNDRQRYDNNDSFGRRPPPRQPDLQPIQTRRDMPSSSSQNSTRSTSRNNTSNPRPTQERKLSNSRTNPQYSQSNPRSRNPSSSSRNPSLSSPRPMHTCAGCQRPITDLSTSFEIEILSSWYHSSCFRCSTCDCLFTDHNPYVPHRGKVYCEKDFEILTTCFACHKPIHDDKVSFAFGRVFHERHLRCNICKERIRGNHVEYNGKVFCKDDYTRVLTQPCSKCNLYIHDEAVHAIGGVYHKNCFGCTTCSRPFPDKKFYLVDNLPFCLKHYHQANNTTCGGCYDPIEGIKLD
jgi:LIM domain